MRLEVEVLTNAETCEHLCNGLWYTDIPCTRGAMAKMDGKALCALHLGIESYEKIGLVKCPRWKKFDKSMNQSPPQ